MGVCWPGGVAIALRVLVFVMGFDMWRLNQDPLEFLDYSTT
jgi:hypothetical protein